MRVPFFIAAAFLLVESPPTFSQTRTASGGKAQRQAVPRRVPRKVVAKPVLPAAPATVLRQGRVLIASGPLPGAVVMLTNSTQMAVTNANGEFQLAVPAGSGALPVTVTYAGFAEEPALLLPEGTPTIVQMTTEQPIRVSKSMELEAFEKTARKEVKRSLRDVHREQ